MVVYKTFKELFKDIHKHRESPGQLSSQSLDTSKLGHHIYIDGKIKVRNRAVNHLETGVLRGKKTLAFLSFSFFCSVRTLQCFELIQATLISVEQH